MMKGIPFLAALLGTHHHTQRALAADFCPVTTIDPAAAASGTGLRCDALVRSVTAAAAAAATESRRESCACYLFCGDEFHSCYSGAGDGDGDAVAVWRSNCDEPVACSVGHEQIRRFLLRPTKVRIMTTEGSVDGTGWANQTHGGNSTDSMDGYYSPDGYNSSEDGYQEGGRNWTYGGNDTDSADSWTYGGNDTDSADGWAYGGNDTDSADGWAYGGNDTDSADGFNSPDGNNSADGDMSPSKDYSDGGQTNGSSFALDAASTSASPVTTAWSVLGVAVSVAASIVQCST